MRCTSRSSCSFGDVVFLPTVLFLQRFSDFLRYFLFLCDLLVIVSWGSSCFCFFLFCTFGCLRFTCPASYFFPWGLFPSSLGSAPLLRHPLRFPICLCFSPVLIVSPPPPPAFVLDVLGFVSVLGVATSPVVMAVAPPFLSSFCSCSVFSACCGSVTRSDLQLLFAVFLCVFFPHAAAIAFSSGLPLRVRMLQLRLHIPVFLSIPPAAALSGLCFLFSACCDSGCSFRFWCSSCFLLCWWFSGCGSSGSGCYISLRSCSFLLPGFCRLLLFLMGLFL